jgi:hypothetical protein
MEKSERKLKKEISSYYLKYYLKLGNFRKG